MVKANPLTVAVAASRFRSGTRTRKRAREKIGSGGNLHRNWHTRLLGSREEDEEDEDDRYRGVRQRDEVLTIVEEKQPSQRDLWLASLRGNKAEEQKLSGDCESGERGSSETEEPPKEKSQHLKDLESVTESIAHALKTLQSLTPM